MKIALVILHADPARGGAERYTADLAAELARRGHEVSILATDFGPPMDGVAFFPMRGTSSSRSKQYLRFLDSVDKQLKAESYDIVHAMLPVRHCDLYHPHAGLAAESVQHGHRKYTTRVGRAAARLGNQLNRKRQLFARVERQLLSPRDPPVTLCLSDYVKRSILNYYKLPDDRLATLFNAVDLERFCPDSAAAPRDRAALGIPPDQTVALMIAQDFARKGLRQAILALKQLHGSQPLLLVVGKDRAAPYRRLARSAGVAEHVRFIGPVSDPRPYYRAADFFVLPTSHDPCSLAVLEALAMGLPVISTVFNGACQIMENGRHGFVLPDAGDTEMLAKAMHTMLDPRVRRPMSQACLALRPQLSFQKHVDNLLAIYASASNRAQKSAARGRL